MTTEEKFGGAAHGGEIEIARDVPVGVVRERILHEAIPDEIFVGLAARIEPGVEGGGNEATLHDADIAREVGVKRALEDGGV